MIIEMWVEILLLALLWDAHPVTGWAKYTIDGSRVYPEPETNTEPWNLHRYTKAVTMTNNNLKVKVPRVAYIGQDAELECTFPYTDPSLLYSIKWWRDNDQFYQYIPKNPEPKMKFKVNGIQVDPENSTEFKVSLKNLSLNSSGAFTCEVISDVNFETFRKSATMTVIDPPDSDEEGKYGPIIKVRGWSGTGPLEVRDGQQVEALCLARNANPPLLLSWSFNGTEVSPEFVQKQSPELVGFNTYTSTLTLILTVNSLWDEQGRVLLRCSAELPGLFKESRMLELHNPTLRRARLTGLFANGFGMEPSAALMTCAVILSLQLIQMTVMSPRL